MAEPTQGITPYKSVLDEEQLASSCRICKRKPDTDVKMRPLFVGDRLLRIISNTLHLQLKNLPGLPQFVCEECLDTINKFSSFQIALRRSEEQFLVAIKQRETAKIDALISFANGIELERQKQRELKKSTIANVLKN